MSSITYSDIIHNIRHIMDTKWRGFKQNAIAERGGYDPKDFSNMLNGRKRIQVSDIPRLAEALEVTPNDLMKPSKQSGEEDAS